MQNKNPLTHHTYFIGRRAFSFFTSMVLIFCLCALVVHAQGEAGTTSREVKGASKEEKPTERANVLRAEIKSAKTDAERARLKLALIDYLINQNRKSEALEELRATVREERFDPTGFYNAGNALARLGDSSAAAEAYRKAIEQRKGNYARAHNNLGVVLLRMGRWDEAYDAFVAALRLENFRYAEASYNLGRLYAARGEADLAIREWRRTLLLDSTHADATLALARALASEGDPNQAVAVLDNYTTRNGANNEVATARREIGGATIGAGRREASADRGYARTTVKSTGSDTSVAPGSERSTRASDSAPSVLDADAYELLRRARAEREAGRDEEAVRSYQRVLALRNGYFPPANLEQSYALINLKRFDEAIASLRMVTTREGERYPMAYYHLARLYEQRGELGPAGEAYERAAMAYGETNPQLLLDVSRVREKEGNYKAALAAMETYIEISTRLGRSPDWSTTRLAELRQKASGK